MPDDLDIYEKQGFGHRMGFGDKPALLIIDFINAFNDADQFGGGNIQSAIDHTAELLAVARISICRSASPATSTPPTAARTASSISNRPA